MPRVAIVILNWNGQHFLKEYLPSLLAHTPPELAKIIVADNASSDDSVAFLKRNYPSVGLIVLERNFGFAEGYNKALAQVEAENYLLLNTDIEVKNPWLELLLNELDEHPDVAACMPVIRSLKEPNKFEYAGAAGGYIDKYGYPFCRGRIWNVCETDEGQYNSRREVFWATGACLLIRANLFHKVGRFDPDFFAHMEEIDLCWRLKQQGYKISVIPSSQVYHLGGGTLKNSSPFKLYLNFRNNRYLLYKNLSDNQLKKTLRVRYVLDFAAFMKFVLFGQLAYARALWKADREFWKNLPVLKEKRKKLAPSKEFPETTYPKSVLFQYFLRRKKKFLDLHFGQ